MQSTTSLAPVHRHSLADVVSPSPTAKVLSIFTVQCSTPDESFKLESTYLQKEYHAADTVHQGYEYPGSESLAYNAMADGYTKATDITQLRIRTVRMRVQKYCPKSPKMAQNVGKSRR